MIWCIRHYMHMLGIESMEDRKENKFLSSVLYI